jgi:hypothetical protein
MNVNRINERISGFIANNRGLLRDLPAIQSQVLELAAAIAAGEHYASFGDRIPKSEEYRRVRRKDHLPRPSMELFTNTREARRGKNLRFI